MSSGLPLSFTTCVTGKVEKVYIYTYNTILVKLFGKSTLKRRNECFLNGNTDRNFVTGSGGGRGLLHYTSEVRIYKRKEESKNKRKKAFIFFLVSFLVESVFSIFFS